METVRKLDHTTERHQRGFKVPMETGSVCMSSGNVTRKSATIRLYILLTKAAIGRYHHDNHIPSTYITESWLKIQTTQCCVV